MELYGRPSRVLIEVEAADGTRLQFPIEGAEYLSPNGYSYGELRVPFRGGWVSQILERLNQHGEKTGYR